MLVEFNVHALDALHQRQEIARIVETLKQSGLHFRLGPMGTCIEGNWDEVLSAIRKCHEETFARHGRVITTITIDDARSQHSLADMVRSVERQVAQDAASAKARSYELEC